MFYIKSAGRRLALAATLVIGLFASIFLIPSTLEKLGQAQAEELATTTCTPVNVAVFVGSRIHVRCAEVQAGAPVFYALSTEDRDVDRILNTLTSAITAGKTLFIFYNKAASANPPGCLEQDCRKIETAVLSR